MLPKRCRWSSMVQGPSRGSEGLWASPQDHGWAPLLTVLYPSGNQQDVSRFEEEFLVGKDEEREIAKYVPECDTCRRVKADHLRSAENLQPLSIPEWKWKNICMDFIMGLPHTSRGNNSIWAIVDRLTKLAHFVPVSTTYRVRQYTELYISHIVRYHGIPMTIISDRGSSFVARFWEQLHECLGTHIIWSSAYHPQTNG
jgi:hypothetical protein